MGQQAKPEFKWLMGVVSKGECASAMVPSPAPSTILEAIISFCRSSVERRSRGFDRVGGLIARGGGWCGLRPGQLVSRQTANKWTKIVKCASASSVLLTHVRPTDRCTVKIRGRPVVRRSHLAFLMKEISSFKGREEGPSRIAQVIFRPCGCGSTLP